MLRTITARGMQYLWNAATQELTHVATSTLIGCADRLTNAEMLAERDAHERNGETARMQDLYRTYATIGFGR